jgi:hypothetical protein
MEGLQKTNVENIMYTSTCRKKQLVCHLSDTLNHLEWTEKNEDPTCYGPEPVEMLLGNAKGAATPTALG